MRWDRLGAADEHLDIETHSGAAAGNAGRLPASPGGQHGPKLEGRTTAPNHRRTRLPAHTSTTCAGRRVRTTPGLRSRALRTRGTCQWAPARAGGRRAPSRLSRRQRIAISCQPSQGLVRPRGPLLRAGMPSSRRQARRCVLCVRNAALVRRLHQNRCHPVLTASKQDETATGGGRLGHTNTAET